MPKSKRTRTGCLCCRRRHKKCDELKPSCKSCLSKGLKCEWPMKGSVFVNYQSQSNNNNGTPINTSSTNGAISDSDSQSTSSNSRKSSFDYSYNFQSSQISLPPIKHYHMVIPRNPTSTTNTTTTSTSTITSNKNNANKTNDQPPAFKQFTFNSLNMDINSLNNFNQAKRLSVDSLLN